MRRQEKEITDVVELQDILKQGRVCRVGMTDGDVPYVVPLNFGYHDGKLYFHSATEGSKIELLKVNPRVCFEVTIEEELSKKGEPCAWGMNFKSVIGFGQAKFVEDDACKRAGLNAIIKHYDHDKASHEFTPEMLSRVSVIEVGIENMTGKKSGT